MDRQGLLKLRARVRDAAQEMEPASRARLRARHAARRPTGGRRCASLTAPIVFLGSLALKLGSLAKFAAIFVAFGGYTLIWGWRFALGLIVADLRPRDGALPRGLTRAPAPRLAGLRSVSWRLRQVHARQSLADGAGRDRRPVLGGFAALGCFLAGRADDSSLLVALGYFGFVLNLINLLPFGILDGGAVWRSTRWLWLGGGRGKALVSGALFAATAVCARNRSVRGVRAPTSAVIGLPRPTPRREVDAPDRSHRREGRLLSLDRRRSVCASAPRDSKRARRSRRERDRGSCRVASSGRASSRRVASAQRHLGGSLALRELRPELGGRIRRQLRCLGTPAQSPPEDPYAEAPDEQYQESPHRERCYTGGTSRHARRAVNLERRTRGGADSVHGKDISGT